MRCEALAKKNEWSLQDWEALLRDALADWEECTSCLPPFAETFTVSEQATREAHLEEFLRYVESELRHPPATKAGRKALQERLTAAFERFARNGLDLGDEHLELLLNRGFSDIGKEMARIARRLDPSVSAADVFQATRNAWTAGGLQLLLGREMRLTPAIFAYSMLYPYTDNYLDDPAVTREEKLQFNTRIRRRLLGEMVQPANAQEARIWGLIEQIEDEYSRTEWPQVHTSLYAIQRAQENSLNLRGPAPVACGPDVVRLSFEKGGASVLADGFLAAGSLSRAEAQFLFEWGALLQLADDLQDLRQDSREGALTIFTQAAGRVPLDALTTQTLNFGHKVMRRMDHMRVQSVPLREMIQKSYVSLLIWSAGECGELYTSAYLAELETHSPFRFGVVAKRRKKLSKLVDPLVRLFEAYLDDEEDQMAFAQPTGAFLGAS